MHPLDLLPSIPASLSEHLRSQTDELLSRIVKANCNTQFAQTASELTGLRHAMANTVDEIGNVMLSESFRNTVQLTTYDSYAPLIAKFYEKPCKESDVVDLFAPGLPDYLLWSSSTSGGLSKTFPNYNVLSRIRSSDVASWTIDPLRRHTAAIIVYFWYDQVTVESEDNSPVKKLYVADSVVMRRRSAIYLDPEKDGEKMATFILDHAAPYAAGFIRKWRSFLLIHALFTASSGAVETMFMPFLNILVDMIRYLDTEFDMVVDCIANGTIPDLDGIADVREHLEVSISPNPERAAELRRLGRPSSRPGWCSHAWPNLHSVEAIASGSFSSYIPSARQFLGPNVNIRSRGYGCTEAWIGSAYNTIDLNQFKPNNTNIIEFLDISKSDSVDALTQVWEVELGKRYELVLTTWNGLWRYRLGDVMEICGFDPTDGVPIIKFIERRNVVIRLPEFMLSEEKLRATMSSVVPSILTNVVGWTTTIDDRHISPTIGFFVELTGDQAPDLALATERMLEELTRSDQMIAWAFAHELFRKPTIRLVRPGTFNDFRQLKREEGSHAFGQFKVPVVLPKATYVTWFIGRVTEEF